MLNESSMKKWLKFEMSKINSGIVVQKKTLSELLELKSSKTLTKDGSDYYFNRDALKKLKDELPLDMHSILLPISFYTSLEVRGSVFIADRPSFSMLKHLGEVPKDAELVDGKYWIGKTLAQDMMKRHPSVIQLVRY
ncbi:MAG: DUF61 family protein [Methanomassiliicoccales archaeon]|nr:MAG: DUF61 family protein [Methanomassiliicoccales archaeon]